MIEVSNISFKYAGQKGLVFDDFSLTLEQNNIYGLLGKNGTGKSTLLHAAVSHQRLAETQEG